MKKIFSHAGQFKQKIANLSLLFGTRISINSLATTESLGLLPFDWFFIDMEHTEVPESQLSTILVTLRDKPCLVRIAKNDEVYIKRALDAGAVGLIIPKVSNSVDAKNAVCSSKVYPLGDRGIGLTRSNGFGENLEANLKSANSDFLLIAQIEDKDGIKNIDSILDVEGIDAVFVGPYDLSISLGVANQFESIEFLESIEEVLRSCKEKEKPIGIFETKKNKINDLINQGFTFFCLSSDISFLITEAKNNILDIKGKFKNEPS